MKAIIQRVSQAQLFIGKKQHVKIDKGLVVLLGIAHEDTTEDLDYIVRKVANCRIFADKDNKMNLSLIDMKGDMLLVSQFTLLADTKKGNRPSFILAARPEKAQYLYNKSVDAFTNILSKDVKTGVFAEHMKVMLINDGPVTISFDSIER